MACCTLCSLRLGTLVVHLMPFGCWLFQLCHVGLFMRSMV